MAFAANSDLPFDAIDEELRTAAQCTQDLFAKIIAKACLRFPLLGRSERAAAIVRLIESGAWTDSALALLELELPLWKIRRVAYESGEWFCSLSRTPNLPIEYDDSVDTAHPVLALAILRTLVEARRRANAARQAAPAERPAALEHVSPFAPASDVALCCDNFA